MNITGINTSDQHLKSTVESEENARHSLYRKRVEKKFLKGVMIKELYHFITT